MPASVDKRVMLQTFSKVPLSELSSGARQSSRFQFDSTDVDDVLAQVEFTRICQRPSITIPDSATGVFVHGYHILQFWKSLKQKENYFQSAQPVICWLNRGEIFTFFCAIAIFMWVVRLEDEFAAVRRACIDAIHSIASGCSLFAGKALDFLVDMFNDELIQARIASIQVSTFQFAPLPAFNLFC